jgi:hypothetical protein
MAYLVHKQLIPTDTSMGDPNWAKRQIWVLKLNANDTIDEFETIEEAQTKVGLLMNEDPSGRIYKVVQKKEDGTFLDI